MMRTIHSLVGRHVVSVVSVTLASLLLIALYLGLRPGSGDARVRPVAAHTFQIDIESDADSLTARSQRGVPVFKVTQGDRITLVAHSTQPGSLHVHVYDLNVPLVVGADATLSFDASLAGAFPIHWHDPQNLMIHLAVLEVQPR